MLHRVIILISLLSLISSFAASQQPVHKRFSTRQGLPSNEVYHVIQDKNGFIWFSTNRGVCRFDGFTFKQFSIENGLCDNTILGMYEDNLSRIWCRSISGRISYIQNDSAFTIEAQTKSYYPNSIYVDNNGVIWTGTQSNGTLYKISPPYSDNNIESFSDTTIDVHIWKNHDGIFFSRYGHKNGRCIFSNLLTGDEIAFQTSQSISNTSVISDGELTVLHSGKFIATIDPDNRVTQYELPFDTQNAYRDREKNLWLCLSDEGGVAMYLHSDLNSQPQIFFPHQSISSVLQDEEGGYWFCSTNDGVYYVPSLNMIEYDLVDIKSSSDIAMLRGRDCILIAKQNGESAILPIQNPATIAFKNLYDHPEQVPIGVRVISRMEKALQHHSQAAHSLSHHNDVSRLEAEHRLLMPANKPFCWGSSPLFCYKADLKTNTILEAYTSPSRINATYNDGDSILILACLDGIWTFKDGVYNEFSKRFPQLQIRINDINIDNTGKWWIATSGNGLYVLDEDSLIQLNRTNGLSSNTCNKVLFSGDSVLIATDDGLCILNMTQPTNFHISSITSKKGLPGKVVNDMVVLGKDLFTLIDDGFYKFSLDKNIIPTIPPRIHITEVSANGKHLIVSATPSLNHSDNFVTFSFIGLGYVRPEANYYKYKLEGIDPEWQFTTTTQINYPSLPPGKYNFSVYAINASDIISTTPSSFQFEIKKPFWLMWWFLILNTLVIVSLISWFIHLRITHARRTALERELIKNKIAHIEIRALRAQMNPHFIFNCINSIQHYILEKDKLVANNLLSKFSRLVRNVLENSNSEFISINKEIATLELYIAMESLRFESKFSHTIEIHSDIDLLLDQIPPLIIQPFVENAINHGLLPLNNRHGELVITLTKVHDGVLCTIEDNGIGRARAMEIKASKNQSYKSMGISMTKERLQIYHQSGQHHRQMELHIEDRYDSLHSPSGTFVSLLLPLHTIKS